MPKKDNQENDSPAFGRRATRSKTQLNHVELDHNDNEYGSDHQEEEVQEGKPAARGRGGGRGRAKAAEKKPRGGGTTRRNLNQVSGDKGPLPAVAVSKEKEELVEEKKESVVPIKRKVEKKNVVKCLDLLQFGLARIDRGAIERSIRNSLVNRTIQSMALVDENLKRFVRRITYLAWHEKYPYALATASKFGDIVFVSGVPNEHAAPDQCPIKFETKANIEGRGAGCSITAMKFDENELGILYRSSIDCTVGKVDLVKGETDVYYDTGSYERWFCSMDVNFRNNMLLAGDNKGLTYQFTTSGQLIRTLRMHKSKIHHFEFSRKDPNLLVSSSLDKSGEVKLWDIRFLKEKAWSGSTNDVTPLQILEHEAAVNWARFSPDGNRLLTSDQNDELRVYMGPFWDQEDCVTIKHRHKQFQHITPVKADWHPLNDYIVIGRFPVNDGKSKVNKSLKAIDFFDSYTGEFVDAIYPPSNIICSLNSYNPTGEYLATGMNAELVLWHHCVPKDISEGLGNFKVANKPSISSATRNILRGRAREYSPVNESDDDENDANGGSPSKKKKSGARGNNTKKVSTTSTSTSTSEQRRDKPERKKK